MEITKITSWASPGLKWIDTGRQRVMSIRIKKIKKYIYFGHRNSYKDSTQSYQGKKCQMQCNGTENIFCYCSRRKEKSQLPNNEEK